MGMAALVQKDGATEEPQQARPVTTVVIAPGPVLRIRPGLVLPLKAFHRRVADAHGHLGHQVVAVVQRQAEQCTLLWGRQQSEQAAE